ncbi:MAG: glycosyltransferase family 4 protein [Gammaproteobacteria bacterium]|nr:glycosyltransferase family 4 protein [Gammaproteobacteria bacterium]
MDIRDSPWVDGPGRTILDSASMADPTRCEIIVSAFCGNSNDDNAYIREAENRSLKVVPILESSSFDRKVIRQIQAAIDKYSIDILHAHDFRSDMFGLICAKLSKKPIVSTCHGWIANNIKGKIYISLDKIILRFFNRIISVSDAMRQQLVCSGVNLQKIKVIRNALVVENYQPDRGKQEFRNELGLGLNINIIANIGRLSPEKGQDIFLRSAAEVVSKCKNVCFVLIGKGPEKEKLEKMAKDLGISQYVVFTGYRSDMHSIYNSVDLVVQSSFTEGMPNVILESLLMGVPVLATRVGGTVEIVSHENTGYLIDPYSQRQLTNGIMNYMSDSKRHRVMAENGRDFVARNFDHKVRIDQLMNLYDEVCR